MTNETHAVREYEAAEETQGDHRPKDVFLQNLGRPCIHLGKYVQAESLLKRALAAREQLYGVMHPDIYELPSFVIFAAKWSMRSYQKTMRNYQDGIESLMAPVKIG